MFSSTSVLSQDSSEATQKFEQFTKNQKTSLTDSVDYYSDLNEVARLKYEIAKEKYFESQYVQYFTENLDHRKQTFDWQLFSTKLIFFTVIIIVLCGLVFSGIQFKQSINHLNKKTASTDSSSEDSSPILDKTEIELSLTNGVKINSSIIGLLILCVSIAFFYLYILYVYPINQINIDNTGFSEIENTTSQTTEGI
ncbi:hypothetical protein [uncultured Psychroserpens sp.]|uniref:hypothetical protein n=1 Tax=uncultured Psychroserpens sp. TaxID=255436 RepID=UPI0026102962|nr:hypothetical protein [uncultured Psychroserpens sp.]